ncbi:MAG: hypothetical protein LBB06_02020 [Endomicrobium sp.]|jgi:hypothetical protein|nr:hypothetical protein [Endomicrobium sp.]
MILTESQLEAAISSSKLGRYDIVKHAIEWIHLNTQNEEFRKLDQAGIINKALSDIVTGVATPEKIEELRQKNKKVKTCFK